MRLPAVGRRSSPESGGKLLHVLGGGPWQLPTVSLAKALGHRVLVTDFCRDRPAYAIADHHEVVDVLDREATLEVAARYGIDGVLCDTTDLGVPTAAYVAEQLGLPGMGYQTALNFTNKGRMRRVTEGAGLSVPRYRVLSSADDLDAAVAAVDFPLLVKPVDNQSGRGVSKIDDSRALLDAYCLARRYSRSGEVLVESCVEGPEVVVDGFAVDGRVQILGIAEKAPYADAVTVSSRILYPAALAIECRQGIEDAAQQTVAALGLRDGVFHAEFILHGPDVVPIDVAARGGGVMIYTHVLPHLTGVNVNAAMIQLALGATVRIDSQSQPRAANVDFLRLPSGRIRDLIGVEAATAVAGVAAVHFNLGPGDEVGPLDHKDRRPGFVVTLGASREEVIACAQRAKAMLAVRFEGGAGVVTVS